MRSNHAFLAAAALLACLVAAVEVRAQNAGVIVITEIMYHPAGGGQELEYIEIFNASSAPIDLSGWHFSNGVSFVFPPQTYLTEKQYLVICADQARIKEIYGINNVVGDWASCGPNGGGCALSNGGEAVELSEENGVVAARVSYNDRGKWAGAADGTGHSLELKDPYLEQDDPDNWDASGALGGSPGKANTAASRSDTLTINEALLRTAGERWVELYNSGDAEIDLAGYWVTDDRANPFKTAIPAGKTIAPRGWIAFTDTELGLDFTPAAETPEAAARTFVALSIPDKSRVVDAINFEPEADEASEARVPDGDEDIVDQADPTRGAANAVTVESDIVINEFNYHAWDGDPRRDFVELYNRSADRAIDIGGWSFTQGINFDFPAGTSIPAGGYLVVARDAAYLEELHGLPAGSVLGPDVSNAQAIEDFGNLRDDGERITLRDHRGNVADTVRYHDGGDWPLWPDGGGSTCELIDPRQDNNVGAAWDASDDSEKSEVREYSYNGTFFTNEPELHLALMGRGITVVDDIQMIQRQVVLEVAEVLLEPGDGWRLFRGTQEPSAPREDWRQPDFDDSAWEQVTTPIGFNEPTYLDDGGTNLDDMRDNYTSIFLRKEFTAGDSSVYPSLVLSIIYDDAFVAYLNGVRVGSGNMRETDGVLADTFDATAAGSREKVALELDITEHKPLLRPGRNVLAIQIHNSTVSNTDLLFVPGLIGGEFVNRDSANLIPNGDFEAPLVSGRIAPGAWLIEGTHEFSGQTAKEAIAGGGSLKIVATGKGDNKVNRLEQTLSGLAPRNTYLISLKAKWVVGSPTLLMHGHNQASANFDYPHSHLLEVPKNLGTPGAVNSVTARQTAQAGAPNLGPVIDKVSQSVAVPAAGEAVEIAARIQDPDGVAGAVVVYWPENATGQPGPNARSEIPMTGPDHRGRFRATIPGQALRTKIVYHIVAEDNGGRAGRYPVDHLVRTHPMALDPEQPRATAPRYLIYRHDTRTSTRYLSYRLWMTYANEVFLSSRKLHSNDLVPATFIFENRDVYHNSAVRFSGSPWARAGWGGSFRVGAPRDRPFHGSIKKFNTEEHQNGGAASALERISHYLIRQNQGSILSPYSFQWLAQMQINDRANGLREHVQTPNTELIQRWYPDDDNGSFFEMDDRFEINDGGTRQSSIDGYLRYPPYPGTGTGDDKEQYRWAFNLRMNEHLDDYSHLIDVARVMTPGVTPDSTFDAQIWDHMDVDQVLRVFAIRQNTDDWDTWGCRRGKNAYLYRPDIDGRWTLLPWDMELTYGSVDAFLPPQITQNYSNGIIFPEVVRMINRPQIKRLYYGILKEMTDRHFSSTFLEPYMVRMAANGMSRTEVGRRNGYIDQRRSRLQTAIRTAVSPAVAFAITTNAGRDFATGESSAVISGRAPVEMMTILATVNGEEPTTPVVATFSTTDVFGWQATVQLAEGANAVEFLGFSGQGDLLDGVSINVTASLAPPTIAAIEPDKAEAGQRVTITGTGLFPGVAVLFGSTPADSVEVVESPTRLEAVVPVSLPTGMVEVVVKLGDRSSEAMSFEIVPPKSQFIRGDVDLAGSVNVGDAVAILHHLFLAQPARCLDAADVNDDGSVNLTDSVRVLEFVFQRGAPPAAPFPEAGKDATQDGLLCEFGLGE